MSAEVLASSEERSLPSFEGAVTCAAARWAVVGAGVVGRDHRAVGRGGQDAWVAGERGELAWGVVSDGCGSGARSEVGAALTVAHLGAVLPRLLASDASLDDVPSRAIGELVEALASIRAAVEGDEAGPEFVHAHLLATVVAFAIRGDAGIVFWQGDGAFLVDDELVVLDEDDRPTYPAYAAVAGPHARRPVGWRRFEARAPTRVAVATDGFDTGVLHEVFGRSAVALGRLLNVRAREGHFADDASVVAAVLAPRGGGPAP